MQTFSAETRRSNLERMAEGTFDVLVVGGGITGCGVALDAAARGLSVALVERDDLAAGTSGRSSRLIHGGVRYLEHHEFGLIHEALRERAILLRLAPHLVHPMRMYIPEPSAARRGLVRAGLALYDGLALRRNVGWHRAASQKEIATIVPGMASPSRGFVYQECRTDDARLTLEVARAAQAHGALIANHAEVTALTGGGRVAGARVVDGMTRSAFEVRARITVSAAGVWADGIRAMAAEGAEPMLRPSKGVHLVFRPGAVDTKAALIVPSGAHDGRFVFVIPWAGRVYVGTTDTEYEGDLDAPDVGPDDRSYVLEAVRRAFPSVAESDVVASWAGLRPLLARHRGATADLSRRHTIEEGPPGLLTITGGKLTTYRWMAEDAVDRAAALLGSGEPSRTKDIPLGMAGSLDAALERAAAGADELGLDAGAAQRLVYRYGDDWEEAASLIRADRSMGEFAVDGLPVLRVELDLARSREMAMTDDDVLVRRTRVAVMDAAAPSAVVRSSAGSDGEGSGTSPA